MFYYPLKKLPENVRVADRLLRLKEKLAREVPAKSSTETLIATWNIREFDSAAYGERSDECLYYIAEIMSHFDLIAVQEVRENLDALKKVIRIMGDGNWDYVVSDVSEGNAGNRERMAFVFDRRSVSFSSIAGEVVLPPTEIKQGNKLLRYDPSQQLYRTPYLCGFRAGWTHLMLCTVHILYGEDTANNAKRAREIELIAQLLAKRARTHGLRQPDSAGGFQHLQTRRHNHEGVDRCRVFCRSQPANPACHQHRIEKTQI